MKKIALAIVVLVLAAGVAGIQAQPSGVKNFAVLPFNYKGPDKHKHLGPGVQSLLETRLSWKDHFMPVPDADLKSIKDTSFPPGMKAVKIIDDLGVDYLFWGNIEAAGDQAKVTIHSQDKSGHNWTSTVESSMSELPVKLTEAARTMTTEIFKRPEDTAEAQKKARAKAGPLAPENPEFIYADTGKPTADAGLNPAFRYEGSPDSPDRWRSQSMRFSSTAMLIDDLDGDGKNEVLIAGTEILAVYEYRDSRLYPLAEIPISNKLDVIRICGIDIDRDKVIEIVVSGWVNTGQASGRAGGRPQTMILNYQGGHLKMIKEDIDLFMNVVKLPPDFMPTLVGQKEAPTGLFSSRGVHEVQKAGNEYTLGNRIALPEFTNVFNFCYLPTDDGSYKLLVTPESGHIRVYTANMELQHETQEVYNGSSLGLPINRRMSGMGPANFQDELGMESYYYVAIPLVVTNFGKHNRFEVLTNKNISVAAMFFDRYRAFAQGEIQSLYWDGVGLNMFWKTQRIKGSVVQYAVADIDNDGSLDLCICLNTYPGALGFAHRKTILVTYNLNIDAHSQKF